MTALISKLPGNQALSSHRFSFIPEFDLLFKDLEDAQQTAYERAMNRDAFLTASSSPQLPGNKLHSCQAIPSLSVAGLSAQTALITCTIGHSAARSDSDC